MYPQTESVLFYAGKQPIPANPQIALWTYKIFFSKEDIGVYARERYRAPRKAATGNFAKWGILLPHSHVPIGDTDPNSNNNQSLIPMSPSILSQVIAEPDYACIIDDSSIYTGHKQIWRDVRNTDSFFSTDPESDSAEGVEKPQPYGLTFCFVSSSIETIGKCEILGPSPTGESPLMKFSKGYS